MSICQELYPTDEACRDAIVRLTEQNKGLEGALEEIREWIVGWYRGDKEGCLMAEINRIAVRALAPEPGTNEPEMGTIEKLAEEQGVSEFNLKENIGAFPDLPDLESCRQNGDS